MFESIKTKLTSVKFTNAVSDIWDSLGNFVQNFDTSNNSVRLLSLILITITFSLFIIMTLFIYIKSIVSLIKEDNYSVDAGKEKKELEEEEIAAKIETDKKEESDKQTREKEFEENKNKENEFQKQQDQDKQRERQQKFVEDEQIHERQRLEESKFKEEELSKNKAQKEEELRTQEKTKNNRELFVDLDWKKEAQNTIEASVASASLSTDFLQYKQSKKSFDELTGLIIDMLSRGVNNLKIAQTIMFRSQGEVSEEQALQIISSIDEFINLCNKKKFKSLIEKGELPTERDALYNLARGDNTPTLALLEALMENSIETSNIVGNGPRKDALFREVSDLSCTFGSIASMNDVHLATGSFELSVELNPSNVLAWSRVADMYSKASSTNKAVWAYHKVIDLADEEMHPEQLANANKALSEYYYDQGNSLQAAKMYNSAKQFYDSIGINRNLDRQELDVIEIIENSQDENIDSAITKLLGRSREI